MISNDRITDKYITTTICFMLMAGIVIGTTLGRAITLSDRAFDSVKTGKCLVLDSGVANVTISEIQTTIIHLDDGMNVTSLDKNTTSPTEYEAYWDVHIKIKGEIDRNTTVYGKPYIIYDDAKLAVKDYQIGKTYTCYWSYNRNTAIFDNIYMIRIETTIVWIMLLIECIVTIVALFIVCRKKKVPTFEPI